MSPKPLVIRTKITPPRLHRRVLGRERITARLLEALDYRLTIIQAGAGYGKSTALAALANLPERTPLAWYHLEKEDSDPLVFLMHLVSACQRVWPGAGGSILAELEHWDTGHTAGSWLPVVERLTNELAACSGEPALLVLDDAHHLNSAPVLLQLLDRLVDCVPPDLHLCAASRYPLRLPGLVSLKARGDLLQIDQAELAFTRTETADLFCRLYGLPLSAEDLDELYAITEGWIIALQLYWQGLKSGAVKPGQKISAEHTGDLFPYLAQEVLTRQPANIQDFLLQTAVLRELTPSLCDELLCRENSAHYLDYLSENGLFVQEIDDHHLRYHPIFRKFLLSRISPEECKIMHTRAGECCLAAGWAGEAVDHFINAGLPDQAASILDQHGSELVSDGRLDALQNWIGALPAEMLTSHPLLLARLGDIGRLRSRFTEALDWYKQAEERSRQTGYTHGVSQALRGQARVYLDTVNASQAEAVLEQVLRLADGQEDRESRARLLELMAENRLNMGHPEEAERYQLQAQSVRESGPLESNLSVRVRLRTGRLAEARRILEERLRVEKYDPAAIPPRSHRETSLLLALILAFQGEGDQANAAARQGVVRGQQLNAPFITAVGYMRQGHARLVQGDADSYADACHLYEQAVELSEELSVPRLRVEALWGLCRAYGLYGQLAAAETAANRGVQKAELAGDEWIKGLICVSMGAGLVQHRQPEAAVRWLDRADKAFHGCSDSFGQAVTLLWQSILWRQQRDDPRLERSLRSLFAAVQTGGYGFLFERRTLLGPPDLRSLVPLLIYARDHEINREEAAAVLRQMGLAELETHPGYRLRVQALGGFRLWRGGEEVPAGEWRREKARQLFQLLVANRRPMDREAITEQLWPGLDPEAAQRDFKVALNALMRVLEPEREKDEPSAYISREGRLYGLRSNADIWLDTVEFEEIIEQGNRAWKTDRPAGMECFRRALTLYHGDFLTEYLYQDWLAAERERLLALYLRTADRLARGLAEAEEWQELIDLCQAILQHDNCWEEAYRLQMLAYDRLGYRAQALMTYRRCAQALAAELGTDPGEAVRSLREQIRQGD